MIGIVTSNKMQKALVVTVYTTKIHSKYNKRFKTRKKYHVHCSDSTTFTVGQSVQIEPCVPISKTIRFRIKE